MPHPVTLFQVEVIAGVTPLMPTLMWSWDFVPMGRLVQKVMYPRWIPPVPVPPDPVPVPIATFWNAHNFDGDTVGWSS